MFTRNAGVYAQVHTASQPRRPTSTNYYRVYEGTNRPTDWQTDWLYSHMSAVICYLEVLKWRTALPQFRVPIFEEQAVIWDSYSRMHSWCLIYVSWQVGYPVWIFRSLSQFPRVINGVSPQNKPETRPSYSGSFYGTSVTVSHRLRKKRMFCFKVNHDYNSVVSFGDINATRQAFSLVFVY
jgi:hypothetical protein